MYPDLSYLLHDFIGTDPDNWTSIFKTFGLMLVLAILSAAVLLYIELKRMAKSGVFSADKVKIVTGLPATPGEIISNGIFGFLLGFKVLHIIQNFPAFQKDPAGILLSLEGNWIAGILLGIVFAAFRYWEKKKDALPKPKEVVEKMFPHDRIGDITVTAAITGIIGAKVFAILEDLPSFFADPAGTFFSGSGLAIYGGLIGGYFGVAWYLRRHKIPFWPFADAVAPALIIAYGVGRIGCQLAGDGDWGIVAAAQPEWWFLPDWVWSFDYPNNVNNANYYEGYSSSLGGFVEGCDPETYQNAVGRIEDRCQEACGVRYCHALTEKVYPTPLYEIIMSFAIGGFLWLIRKRFTIPGILFCIYLMLNGIERFVIEKIRVNLHYDLWGIQLTQAEIIAVSLFLIGAVGAVLLRKRHQTE